jgi:hypothetical protein
MNPRPHFFLKVPRHWPIREVGGKFIQFFQKGNAMGRAEKVMSDAVAQAADREGKYLTFSLAGEEYGIGILKIREIIGMLPITSVRRPRTT